MSHTDNTRPIAIQLVDDAYAYGGKNSGNRRVKPVRKDLNKRFRLHGRQLLRGLGRTAPETFDIPPIMTGARCAMDLTMRTDKLKKRPRAKGRNLAVVLPFPSYL